MRNFKRFLTLALAMVMLVSAFAMGTSAAKFTDVDEENEYLVKAVNLLSYVGVTKGTTETTFGTDELVTREQMAAFIYRLMKKGNSVEGGNNTSAFTDLEDPTFFFMVSWANNQGIIKGTSATTFEPKGTITLQDAYTMVVRALGYENEETLAYPYGYIDVAEAKGVELGEGLDSSVSYTDALTRGDVAIILYNAFFAETGVAETTQEERLVGKAPKEGEDDLRQWVLQTVTKYPTFCEKYFDVIKVEYQAVATPNYVFDTDTTDGKTPETTAELGYEAIEFSEIVDDTDTDAPNQVYIAFEDLGLDGEANDYIMSHFTMYVVLDDEEIEEILYAEPLMVKKTVNEIELGTVTTNTKNSYLDSDYSVKVLNGKVEFNGETAYFYDAPYSYATPKYTSSMDEDDKYDERNAENLQFIDFSLKDNDPEAGEYVYAENRVTFENTDTDKYYINNAKKLIGLLEEVFVGGLYEADVYDVDGDGLYDYINYKPYSAYFANTDEDFTFFDDKHVTVGDKTEVYTTDAVIEGVEFEDGDYVIGYFNEAANYIKVAAVVEPIKGGITKVRSATGMITLNGETEVSVKDGWKAIKNYAKDLVANEYDVEKVSENWTEFDNLLKAGALDKDDAEFYVYEDVLLFQSGIDNFITFEGKLLVVTEDENGDFYEVGGFNPTTGKATYIHVWVDGTTKWVPLNTESEIEPAIDNLEDAKQYRNKIATYSVDNDLYTIELLAEAVDENGDYIGITHYDQLPADKNLENEENEDIQAYKEYTAGYLVKRSGQRYILRDDAKSDANRVETDFEFILTDATIILVKNTYKDADNDTVIDWIELKAEDIKETVASELKNLQVIVANNVDYTNREDLVVLYAEFDSNDYYDNTVTYGDLFELSTAKKSSKSERIVKMMDVELNEDGKYYAVYDLFNPYTGAVVENVAGTNTSTSDSYSSQYTYGDVVEVTTDGRVADKSTDSKLGNILDSTNKTYYWVTDYIPSENVIEVIEVPVNATNDTLDDAVENSTFYRIDVSDVAVSIIGHQSQGIGADMVRFGSLKVADVAKLDGSDKSYLAVRKNWSDPNKPNAPLKTVYSNYVKIYLDAEWENAADEDTGIIAEANFIVVIADNNEDEDLCVLK